MMPESLKPPAGFTLIEALLVLLLTSLLVLLAVGEATRMQDALAVQLSREEVIGLIAETRLAARVHGGATLVLDEEGAFSLLSGAGTVLRHWNPAPAGVTVTPGTRTPPVELHFGPTGLGRAASLTISFRRGQAGRVLVLSSYGRIRRDG
jgi:type II secretory pathway pseudopilin PulG